LPLCRHGREDVDELVPALPDRFVESQVFVAEDAVIRDQFAMHGKGEFLVRIGRHFGGPGVRADQLQPPFDRPACHFHADAGFAGIEAVIG